jgi:hypothetical protein
VSQLLGACLALYRSASHEKQGLYPLWPAFLDRHRVALDQRRMPMRMIAPTVAAMIDPISPPTDEIKR